MEELPIRHQGIWQIVNDYEAARKEIVTAYEILKRAQNRLETFCAHSFVLPNRQGLHDDEWIIKKILSRIKSSAWQGILEKTNASDFMTPKRYDRFQRDLDDPDKLPEITFEAVSDFVENVINAAPDMLVEFIKESFDWLQPRGWAMRQHKISLKNQYELQEKVIKLEIFELKWNGGCDLKYYFHNPIAAMDNAFRLLDGKGMSKPKSEDSALNRIRNACENNLPGCETEYFKFKWYKNGNLHLTFKRMDLVAKMNRIAGENLVKPE